MYYENVFIVHPDLSTANAEKVVDELVALVEKHGGRVVKRESWGVRPLAYRIAHRKRGHYFLIVVDGEPDVQRELERAFRLSDHVIRWLCVRVDEVSDKPSPLAKRTAAEPEGGADAEAA